MVGTVKNLRVDWVDRPREEWVEDLLGMAEGYPFEKRRRSLQDLDAKQHCRRTWEDGSDDRFFLGAHFGEKLVGWIQLTTNELHTSVLGINYLDAKWELIQRNRDDIRNRMMEAIRSRFSESVIHFQQPAQNRTARQCLDRHEDVVPGGEETYLARSGDSLLPRDSAVPDGIEPVHLSTAEPLHVWELLEQYDKSYLHDGPLHSHQTAVELHQSWFERELRAESNMPLGLAKENRLAGAGLFAVSSPPSETNRTSGAVNYLQVHSEDQNEGLGSFLLRYGETLLIEQGASYVEIKLNSYNEQALSFYRDHGYQPVSKRNHFYRVPSDLSIPL